MQITWVGMTRAHYQPGSAGRVRAIVIHATAGRAPSDLAWLRQGGDPRRPVSVHYYIDKAGRISQLVRDEEIAWHAGRSRWPIDGREQTNLNAVSIGIELENLNSGRDPYPEVQYQAALWLSRRLIERYRVPRGQLVRHLDISPGRKTDPAGFPWQRFVADAYATQPRLADLMRDQAFQAAGGGLSRPWTLFEQATTLGLGMPVAVVSGCAHAPAEGSAQDDCDRAVWLDDQPPLVVEIYARDLLYAPAGAAADEPPAPGSVVRLSATPPGPLRDQLTELLFRVADPVHGLRPEWPLHAHYLSNVERLGAPIGPLRRIFLADRSAFLCQHFAFDTLCVALAAPHRVLSMSDLAAAPPAGAAELPGLLLDDLYRTQTGRRYAVDALLPAEARRRGLGAPLAPPEVLVAEGGPYLIMPFAGDVLACPLPDAGWPIERPLPAETPVLALGDGDTPALAAAAHALLGVEAGRPLAPMGADAGRPALLDLAFLQPPSQARVRDTLLVCAAPGPFSADLAGAARNWHYYLDRAGNVYQLADEHTPLAPPAGAPGWLADRSLMLAVEGGPRPAGPAQQRALAWLLADLIRRHGIPRDRIRTPAPRRPAPSMQLEEAHP